MTVDDHFKLVASVYDSLRTTDEAPVRRIRDLLPDGPLAELQAGRDGRVPLVPLRCTVEELPVRTGSLDLVTAFNSVHHFELGRFLAEAARVLSADGRRTPPARASRRAELSRARLEVEVGPT